MTNASSNTVSVIDTATNTVIETTPVGTQPFGVAINHIGTTAYAANAGAPSNSISVIDIGSNVVVDTVPVGNSPRQAVVALTANSSM